jgi:hypothetical protein
MVLLTEWFIERHYVRFAGRSVWRTTLSVSACQQRTGAWLTNRTTINLRNFGTRSFSYGDHALGLSARWVTRKLAAWRGRLARVR